MTPGASNDRRGRRKFCGRASGRVLAGIVVPGYERRGSVTAYGSYCAPAVVLDSIPEARASAGVRLRMSYGVIDRADARASQNHRVPETAPARRRPRRRSVGLVGFFRFFCRNPPTTFRFRFIVPRKFPSQVIEPPRRSDGDHRPALRRWSRKAHSCRLDQTIIVG